MAKVQFKNFEEFRQMDGQELPVGDWITISQEMIQHFADATLDYQWIHVDEERSKKESPFGTTIAHGFMSASMLSHMIESLVHIETARMGVNYGMNRLRFPHPVLAGSRLRLHCKIGGITDYQNRGIKVIWNCEVEIEGIEKPACVADFISLVFD
ncbi:MAG: MaoC family dehydratase [Bacteroidota bacterium]